MGFDRRRASDDERERAVRQLRDAMVAGRLSHDEFDQRVAAAYQALTRGELAALLADLPARPAAGAKPLPWLPGMLPFSASWRGPADPRRHGAAVLRFLGPVVTNFGYVLVDRTADRLVYRRGQRPFAAVLLGLPAILAGKHIDTITIDMIAADDHTLAVVQGVAPLRLRRAFAQLERGLEHTPF